MDFRVYDTRLALRHFKNVISIHRGLGNNILIRIGWLLVSHVGRDKRALLSHSRRRRPTVNKTVNDRFEAPSPPMEHGPFSRQWNCRSRPSRYLRDSPLARQRDTSYGRATRLLLELLCAASPCDKLLPLLDTRTVVQSRRDLLNPEESGRSLFCIFFFLQDTLKYFKFAVFKLKWNIRNPPKFETSYYSWDPKLSKHKKKT